MARVPTPFAVQDPAGNALDGIVYLYKRGTTTQADAYAAESGGAPLAQPVSFTGGNLNLWAADGSYDLKITTALGTYTKPWTANGGTVKLVDLGYTYWCVGGSGTFGSPAVTVVTISLPAGLQPPDTNYSVLYEVNIPDTLFPTFSSSGANPALQALGSGTGVTASSQYGGGSSTSSVAVCVADKTTTGFKVMIQNLSDQVIGTTNCLGRRRCGSN
jgi:hypothetical protein